MTLVSNLDHVGNVVLVPWRIEDGVPLLLGFEMRSANLDRDALGPLLLIGVHDVGHVPALAVLLLGLSSRSIMGGHGIAMSSEGISQECIVRMWIGRLHGSRISPFILFNRPLVNASLYITNACRENRCMNISILRLI